MMIKKLNKQFVETHADLPPSEIAWAAKRGLVATSADDENTSLAYPIYDDKYDISSSRYDVWKRLFIARILRDLRQEPRRLFEEVADVAVAFGYPEDMKELVYFMPATGEGSEEILLKRIVKFAGRAAAKE
jgi:hypothetical protein